MIFLLHLHFLQYFFLFSYLVFSAHCHPSPFPPPTTTTTAKEKKKRDTHTTWLQELHFFLLPEFFFFFFFSLKDAAPLTPDCRYGEAVGREQQSGEKNCPHAAGREGEGRSFRPAEGHRPPRERQARGRAVHDPQQRRAVHREGRDESEAANEAADDSGEAERRAQDEKVPRAQPPSSLRGEVEEAREVEGAHEEGGQTRRRREERRGREETRQGVQRLSEEGEAASPQDGAEGGVAEEGGGEESGGEEAEDEAQRREVEARRGGHEGRR